MAEIYQIPENGGTSPQFTIPIGGMGGGGIFGNGQTNLIDLFGFAIIASMFPNLFGGNAMLGGGAGVALNQDLVMNAVTAEGAASRSAIQNLATSVGQDFNVIYGAVQNAQNTIASLASANGMGFLQVINALQTGNASLSAQLSQCCCDNRLLTTQQGYEAQIRTLEQTNQLGAQADRNANGIMNAINAQTVAMNDQFCALKEREMQAKIDAQADTITQLRGQIDNSQQTSQIMAYINSIFAPLQAEITKIADKMPNTVPVQYPNLVAVNNTPYNGNNIYGNGFGNNIVF